MILPLYFLAFKREEAYPKTEKEKGTENLFRAKKTGPAVFG
jgi:hypothetical protein